MLLSGTTAVSYTLYVSICIILMVSKSDKRPRAARYKKYMKIRLGSKPTQYFGKKGDKYGHIAD